jgi:hypothetical protein
MAKRKKFSVGGVDFDPHFNNPVLQKAYEKWFLNMPLRAPVEVEYYDPTETSTGEVKRSPINTRLDPYEVARGEMMSKYKYGWESGNEPVFPQHPVVTRKYRQGGSKGTKAAKKIDKKLGAGAADLLTGTERANARVRALGGKPAGQQSHNSLWNRTLDILSRGNYMSAEAINAATKDADKNNASIGSQLKAFGGGAIQGVTGKKKTTFGSILHAHGFGKAVESGLNKLSGGHSGFTGPDVAKRAGRYAEAGTGLLLDVGLDPSTYAGVGLIAKGGKAAKGVAEAISHLEEGSKIISRGRKTPHTYDEIEKELLSGGRHVAGKVRHSEEALIIDPLNNLKSQIANVRFREIKQGLRETSEWADVADRAATVGAERKALRDSLRVSDEWASRFDKAKNITEVRKLNAELNAVVKDSIKADTKKISDLNKTAKEMAEKEAEEWKFTALKNYQDIVNTRLERGLGIGVATGIAGKGKKITIIPAPVLGALSKQIHSIDPVDRGLRSMAKYLQASQGITPDLHNLRQQATNAGMTRAEFLGNRLRVAFSGVHRDIRENTWENALDGTTHSGQIINVDGVEKDAAKFYNDEIAHLDSFTTGTATGNTPISAREMNVQLPPGVRYRFVNGKRGVVDVRKSLKTWDLKDGPQALWLAQQAYERANTMRGMYTAAADSLGLRTIGPGALKNAKMYESFRNRGWREISEAKTHGLLKGVLFDSETAKGLEKLIDLMNNERNWNKWMRKLSRITSPIKFAYTVINPGYHIRNSIGDAFINEMDNVSLNSYGQAAQVLRGASEKYGGVNPLIMAEGNLVEQAFKRPSQTVLFHTKHALKKPGGVRSSAVTEAEIFGGMNQYGITQNFTLSEFHNFLNNPAVMGRRLAGKVKTWMISKSEMRENYFRLAHFIELVKKNPGNMHTLDEAMAYAAARVRKMHFDYTDFTPWEKQFASQVIPFYKWTRKAVPLMMELMFTNPGKAIIPSKLQTNLSIAAGYPDPREENPFPNLQGMLPDWMIEAGYTPGNLGAVFGSNKQGMFDFPDPFSDTFQQTIQPLQQAVTSRDPERVGNFFLQQSNPAIKAPYELYENKNTFLSRSGEDVPIYHQDTKKKDILNYISNQLPYVRQLNRAFGGGKERQNLGALSSQLTGIYSQELTPSIVKGELYRQEQEASSRWLQLKKDFTKQMQKQGIKPPQTSAEWEDFLEAYAKSHGRKYSRPVYRNSKTVPKKKLDTIL